MGAKNYTEYETTFIRKHYPCNGPDIVAEALGRSRNAILRKAKELHVRIKPLYEYCFCKVEYCNELHYSNGYCKKHFYDARRKGTFSNKKCIVPDCPNYALNNEGGLCSVHKGRKYYKENTKKVLKRCKKYREDHKEESLIYQKNWYKENKIEIKRKRKKFREENKEHRKEQQSKYYKKYYKDKWGPHRQQIVTELLAKAFLIYGCKCQICGNKDIITFNFHHRKGMKGKRGGLETLARKIVKSGKILDDIILVCSNCHIHQDLIDGTNNRGKTLQRIKNNTLKNERDRVIKEALKIYDNKCEICNCNDLIVLEWHHINRNPKKIQIINDLRKVKKSGNKDKNLLLVCANCHCHENLKLEIRNGQLLYRVKMYLEENNLI